MRGPAPLARLAPLLPLAIACLLLHPPAQAAGPEDAEAKVQYQTQPGDTLIGIARRHLVDPQAWPQLQRLNRIRDPRRMPIGQPLLIPLSLVKSEAANATLVAARGRVEGGGQLLAAGQALGEGSEVVTGPDGQVTVRLVDGTVLRLRAAGRLRIDESRRISIGGASRSRARLEQGRVEVEAAPARGGQPGFRIGTPQGVMAVRGTQFRVEADAGLSRNEVLEGAVGVSGSGPETRVVAGFGTVIDASGRVADPVALLPAPDLSALPALHERPLVRLQMPPLAGAQGYRLQIGRDAGFDSLLVDLRTSGSELRIAGLDDGRYPYRVRAVGAQGLEGRDAQGLLVLKARPEPPLPRAPAPRAVIVGDALTFSWAASSEAARYRLQVARAGADGFVSPLHDLRGLDTVSHALQGLAPGAYQWRLASLRADGDQGPFGDALGFEMRAPPPVPAAPGLGAPPAVGDHGVRLFWQGRPGERFDFQMARDAAFTQLVVQRELQGNEIELPLPGDGRFHVRLRARDADGFVGPWSASQHFDVIPCVRDSSQACVRVDGGTLRRP